MTRQDIEKAFPRMRRAGYNLTSPATREYNCIAWAAGDNERHWQPDGSYYWPPGVERKWSLDTLIAAFGAVGYAPCDGPELEKGFEKVALFADGNGIPTHAARQVDATWWTSKLGWQEDIRHTLYGMETGFYGSVVAYLKRQVPQE